MSYFKGFPVIQLNDGSYGMNITARVKMIGSYKDNERAFYTHIIQDGETPEIIADKFYDDVELAWVVMMFNDIFNVYTQWPVDQYTLNEYIDEKYEDPNDIHHYVSISTGNIVDSTHVLYDRLPVTNREYENDENDSKREIRLVLPELVANVISQQKELMARVY